MPLAAVRATREVTVKRGGERLPAIAGVPMAGERVGGEIYDGETEIALFPGDLPDDPESIFEVRGPTDERALAEEAMALRFLRFRPPQLERTAEGLTLSLPHIRLDQTLQYLIGDKLAMKPARRTSRAGPAPSASTIRRSRPSTRSTLEALEPEQADAHKAVEAIAHPPRRGIRWGALALVDRRRARLARARRRARFAGARPLRPRRLARLARARACSRSSCSPSLAMVGRELAGLFRLKRLARLRLAGDDAAAAERPRRRGRRVRVAASRSTSDRPETAKGRRRRRRPSGEIMDGRDLLMLAERDLIAPLDAHAPGRSPRAAARRVSVVTAVSPRAFFDVLFVLWECVRLIRRIAAIYGGRPGTLGLFRLMKAVVSHLAVTGSIAVGDTLLQQFVGHGLAGRLSTKLGEGVVNGLMTARIGLSAMDVCRPLPFLKEERPRLKDLAGDLANFRAAS